MYCVFTAYPESHEMTDNILLLWELYLFTFFGELHKKSDTTNV